MAESVYLGVDLGAESGRVMAGCFSGDRIRLEEIHRFPNGAVPVAGTLRWDVLRLWAEIQTGLGKAARQFGDAIRSVGVDTWGVDYVLMSKGDELLGQSYNHRDHRTQGLLEAACSRVPMEEIFAQTGVQFMEINTLYQLLAFQRDHPELLALVDRILLMPDYFHWLLCGSRVVEFTNGTTTQCIHPLERNWSFPLLKRFELPSSMFPEIVTPGTQLGTLREEVSRATGLDRIPVVAPPTHDTAAAVVAVPTENTGTPNWAYISSGTWSLIGVEVTEAIQTPEALEQNVTNEGGVDGTYRLLKNVMGLWLVQGCRRSFLKQGAEIDYPEMAELAAQAEPFRSLIDPNDISFLNPTDMVEAIQEFCRKSSQPVPETEGQLVRCALESLALKYRQVLRGLEQLTGVPVEVMHIVGGGSNNELLNQLTSDACGIPVISGPTEATVIGNVLTQARAAGEISDLGQIRWIVRNSYELKRFEPAKDDSWNAAIEQFESLCG